MLSKFLYASFLVLCFHDLAAKEQYSHPALLGALNPPPCTREPCVFKNETEYVLNEILISLGDESVFDSVKSEALRRHHALIARAPKLRSALQDKRFYLLTVRPFQLTQDFVYDTPRELRSEKIGGNKTTRRYINCDAVAANIDNVISTVREESLEARVDTEFKRSNVSESSVDISFSAKSFVSATLKRKIISEMTEVKTTAQRVASTRKEAAQDRDVREIPKYSIYTRISEEATIKRTFQSNGLVVSDAEMHLPSVRVSLGRWSDFVDSKLRSSSFTAEFFLIDRVLDTFLSSSVFDSQEQCLEAARAK